MRPVMIFGAGFGTRMGALTKNRPKPLVDVAGQTLLDRTLGLARAFGSGPIVVNAHYLADQMAGHLAGATDVALVIERPVILDTGGGLKAAIAQLGAGIVATMNSDAVFAGPNPLQVLEDAWRPGMGALLLCVPPDRAIGHPAGGDFAIGADGMMRRGGPMIYTGVQIIDTGWLDDIGERVFSLNSVWDRMEHRAALHGVSYPGQWADVGTPKGIALAEAMLAGEDD